MSVGNLKNSGNKGNNFPFQLAVLKLLDAILAASGGGGGGCCPPVARVPSMSRANSIGATVAGARSVSFYNAGATTAIVLGANLLSGESVTFSAGSTSDTLPVIAYDATGTDLLITVIV